jgi:hypothetical protein
MAPIGLMSVHSALDGGVEPERELGETEAGWLFSWCNFLTPRGRSVPATLRAGLIDSISWSTCVLVTSPATLKPLRAVLCVF